MKKRTLTRLANYAVYGDPTGFARGGGPKAKQAWRAEGRGVKWPASSHTTALPQLHGRASDEEWNRKERE